jgi:hypothetical protein
LSHHTITPGLSATLPLPISHYGVTGSMRWSWVRLSLFEEL